MSRLPDPERWTERQRGGRAVEDRLGEALRGVGPPRVPTDAALARVLARVVRPPAPGRGGVLATTVGALLVLVGASAAVAQLVPGARSWPVVAWFAPAGAAPPPRPGLAERRTSAPAPVESEPRAARRDDPLPGPTARAAGDRLRAGEATPSAPTPGRRPGGMPEPRRVPVAAARPLLARAGAPGGARGAPGGERAMAPPLETRPVPAPGALDVGAAPGARAVTTGPAPGTLPLAPGPLSGAQAAGGTGRGSAYSGSEEASGEASEAAIVAGALRALRSERSAERALARLDEHARRFPGGPLALEAAVVRAEALLSLDRPREALAVLERLPPTGQRIDRELIVARGELRARLGACGAARLDFEEVLAGGLRDVFDERALYGLGSCRLQIGDRDGALAALSRYLSLYPAGRFATAVRRALEPPGAAGARP